DPSQEPASTGADSAPLGRVPRQRRYPTGALANRRSTPLRPPRRRVHSTQWPMLQIYPNGPTGGSPLTNSVADMRPRPIAQAFRSSGVRMDLMSRTLPWDAIRLCPRVGRSRPYRRSTSGRISELGIPGEPGPDDADPLPVELPRCRAGVVRREGEE